MNNEFFQHEARKILENISKLYEITYNKHFSGEYNHKCKNHDYKYRIEVNIRKVE
jgi:hypothetical protein